VHQDKKRLKRRIWRATVIKKNGTCLWIMLLLFNLLFAGCSQSSSSHESLPLNSQNLNLIFVVSPDLAYQGKGDINPETANLSSQGLQRSLLMATYLKQKVLGGNNVTSIYALQPNTHLQTENDYPDMASYGYIQQFALLNQITLNSITAYSYPIKMSSAGAGKGLNFYNTAGNLELVNAVIDANTPGYYVFCAPWETISALLDAIKNSRGYHLELPTTYQGPDNIYAIVISTSGNASLVTYISNLNPPSIYPVLPLPVARTACGQQAPFNINRTGGVNGVVVPTGMNVNQTVYIIRHAEAHPVNGWEDGNFVGSGQWRALELPNALRGKITMPDKVYSIDPSLPIPPAGTVDFSYIRPSLTALPYAIANNLPYQLALLPDFYQISTFQTTSEFFFTGGAFSNQTLLVAWEHDHIPPTINYLLWTYGGTGERIDPKVWLSADYDTIWTIRLDAQGNLTVDNSLCEGIDSASLPAAPPQY
jgi:hypothetical protein